MLILNAIWYQNQFIIWPLLPFSYLFSLGVRLRRLFYKFKVFLSSFKSATNTGKPAVPVIVVGNLTIGGTGKTPLVIYIAELFKSQGLKPGILSAGYKGKHNSPTAVSATSDTKLVGDEAVVLARRLQCPMIVGQNRKATLQKLLQDFNVDVVISDDGLQHYPLARHIEIVVIDGERRFGNGHCLPAGPLREPQSRLKEVDFIVANGGMEAAGEYSMQCIPNALYLAQQSEQQQTLESFINIINTSSPHSRSLAKVHAVAGLGNPSRFFQLLKSFGLNLITHIYPDHHEFQPQDILFNDTLPVIMTEKDVVKCMDFVDSRHWVLPITVKMNALFDTQLLNRVKELRHE